MWTKVEDNPREFQPSGSGVLSPGWAWDLERGGDRSTVEVVRSDFLLTDDEIAEDAKRAIATKGESAIDLWLDQETLPPQIVIHRLGLTPPGPLEG